MKNGFTTVIFACLFVIFTGVIYNKITKLEYRVENNLRLISDTNKGPALEIEVINDVLDYYAKILDNLRIRLEKLEKASSECCNKKHDKVYEKELKSILKQIRDFQDKYEE